MARARARGGREASRSASCSRWCSNYEARPRELEPAESARGIHPPHQSHAATRNRSSRFGAPELVSTLSVAVIEGDRLYGLNVGDSRVYSRARWRARRSSRWITSDEHHATTCSAARSASRRRSSRTASSASSPTAMSRFLCSDGVSNLLERRRAPHAAAAPRRRHARSSSTRASSRRPETLDDMSAIVLDIAETG